MSKAFFKNSKPDFEKRVYVLLGHRRNTLKLQKVCHLHVPHTTFTHIVSQLLGELHKSGLVSVIARVLGHFGSHFSVIMFVFATFSPLFRSYLLHAPIFHRYTSTWVITTSQQKGRLFLHPAVQGGRHFPLYS